MGAGEEGTPTKSSKPASSSQETHTTPAYPDWSSSMQAFYGAGANPPFFAPNVASPTPHPYMWGNQHPMMPPYGTPVTYPALYPPGGVYAHPNMATTSGAVHGSAELNGKGKDRASSKKTKGSSGNIGGKIGGSGKATSGSGNDVGTQSAESGSDDSSDESDDNNQEYSASKKGSFEQMLADGANAQSSILPANYQSLVPANNATNLNMGMDLWSASAAGSGAAKSHNNPAGASNVGPSGIMNDQWVKDDRELKRQKRKQSNRESARRSRLRKQTECEELQHRVEALNSENRTLRDELQRLSEECEKLTSENNSFKDELISMCGADVVSKLVSMKHAQSRMDEGNC